MPALVTDELWGAIAPHLPAHPRDPRGGRPRVSDRAALAGILFVLREGLRWQSLPAERGCGSGSTCWRRFAEWTAAGVWDKAHAYLLAALGERGLVNLERAVIDSASTRAVKGGRTPGPIRPIAPGAA
jgi:transposase